MLTEESTQRLLDAGRSLVSELALERVLERLLDTAREITGARYAAIGVLNRERHVLEQFLTVGIDEATQAEIGDLPHGRGVLGLLIEDPKPLVLDDVSAHPRSYGFPAGHPRMKTFLGVPLMIRGAAWGNVYLADKRGGGFDDEDVQSVTVLAEWASIAIEHAQAFESLADRTLELQRAVEALEATTTIARAVGSETDLDRVLELIVKRGRALVHARAVVLLLLESDHLVAAAGAGQVDDATLSAALSVESSVAGEVLRRGTPERILDVAVRLAVEDDRMGIVGAETALLVPLRYREHALGVLCAFDRLDDDAGVRRPRRAAARGVRGQRRDRGRDGADRRGRPAAPQPALGRAGAPPLGARAARRDAAGPRGARRAPSAGLARGRGGPRAGRRQATEQLTTEIANLRALITELRPAALDELGLVAALEGLARRAREVEGLELDLRVDVDEAALDAELKTVIYRLVQEALTNVAKHASADRVEVSVSRQDGELHLRVADDGAGFDADEPTAGFGLVGMRERAALMGGTLDVVSSRRGTVVSARFST